MTNLFSPDEELAASPAVVGYKILTHMKQRKARRMSIFDIADHLVGERWFDAKHLYLALMFLFSVGLVDLHGSYVVLNA